jgi:hypothetical protein
MIWIKRPNKLAAMRRLGQSYSEVISACRAASHVQVGTRVSVGLKAAASIAAPAIVAEATAMGFTVAAITAAGFMAAALGDLRPIEGAGGPL